MVRSASHGRSDNLRRNARWGEEVPPTCAFCGESMYVSSSRLIPVCPLCGAQRNDRGIIEWRGPDALDRLIAGRYLKRLLQMNVALGRIEATERTDFKVCARSVRCRPVVSRSARSGS